MFVRSSPLHHQPDINPFQFTQSSIKNPITLSEEADMAEDSVNGSLRGEEGRAKKDPEEPDVWFTSDGSEDLAVSEKTYGKSLENLYVVVKFLTQFLVFLLTLAAAVVSKGSTFFMVSQLSNHPVTTCNTESSVLGQRSVINTPREKVGWIWCIFFAF